jgi:hypothetical protein
MATATLEQTRAIIDTSPSAERSGPGQRIAVTAIEAAGLTADAG